MLPPVENSTQDQIAGKTAGDKLQMTIKYKIYPYQKNVTLG